MPFDLEKMQDLFERLVAELHAAHIPASYYCIDTFDGYTSITGNQTDKVFCLQAELGLTKNGRTYAFAQVFWDKYPNLVLIGMVVLNNADEPLPVAALYNRKIDAVFSKIFLPLMYRAFNNLDPSGKLRGQVVQRYSGTQVLFEDLLPAIGYTLQLVLSRSLFGQYATIGVDFSDKLTRFIAWLIQPLKKANHLYVIPQTERLSSIRIPLRNSKDPSAPFELRSSDALDEAFSIASQYLEGDAGEQYQS